MTDGLAKTPDPPYYAVIFTNRRAGDDEDGYAATAEAMRRLAARQPGYLGYESVRGDDGVGITVSYWRDEASLKAWKQVAEHAAARRLGRQRWYDAYELRVARVERAYNFERG